MIVWACRGLVWLEPLQSGNSDVTGEKNEPVFGPYRTAVHQNGTIEQHFAGALAEASPWRRKFEMANCMRIPMMSISHSDLMPIKSERRDAGLSQFEIVIGISQYFCLFL